MFSQVLYVSRGEPHWHFLRHIQPTATKKRNMQTPCSLTSSPLPPTSLPPSSPLLICPPLWLLCTSPPFSFFHSSPHPLPRQVHLSSTLLLSPLLSHHHPPPPPSRVLPMPPPLFFSPLPLPFFPRILHPPPSHFSPLFLSIGPSQKMLNSHALARKPSDSCHTPTSMKTFTFFVKLLNSSDF